MKCAINKCTKHGNNTMYLHGQPWLTYCDDHAILINEFIRYGANHTKNYEGEQKWRWAETLAEQSTKCAVQSKTKAR